MPTVLDITTLENSSRQVTSTTPESCSCKSGPLLRQFTSPTEAVGAMARELLNSRGQLCVQEIQLMLIVRLKLSSDAIQRNILQDAILLTTERSLPDAHI